MSDQNRRKLIRIDAKDFLEIRPLTEPGKKVKARGTNFTLMGICFSSVVEWRKGQVLYIDYFIPEQSDSVKLKITVVWSEFIDNRKGFFCGGEIVEVESEKQEQFANYYFQKLKEKFFK